MKINKKTLFSVVLIASFLTVFTGCTKTNPQLEKEIGAFEITAHHRETAKTNSKNYPVLDAGRGNPNWINTQARYAFSRFMNFALSECELDMQQTNMAGHAQSNGIGERFDKAMNPKDKTDTFLLEAVNYCVKNLGIEKDSLLKEFTDGIIGCYYPSPSRSLKHTETILKQYIQSTLCNKTELDPTTQIFPVEGGTAAIVYLFHSFNHNHVLNAGDRIAIATPIFTPYLQIPYVNNYDLVSINVESTSDENWDIPEEEIKKLENKDIKAFFLVNPSNPASRALSQKTLDRLEKAVKKNPELIILTDDVYGTFVKNFQTVYSRLPYNTVLVYSFSKLYGVTGWRIGLIAMTKNNVIDKKIANLPTSVKKTLNKDYSIVVNDVENFPFSERIVADSRSIGLYHTSGLSTPQQIFMDFLALTHLVNKENDAYINLSNEICHQRYETLYKNLGLEPDESAENAQYYTIIDLKKTMAKAYGEDFAQKVMAKKSTLEILNDLAEKEGVVVMYGHGFAAPEGTCRISLANLNEEDYAEIAGRIFELFEEYKSELK